HDLQEPIRKLSSFAGLVKSSLATGDMEAALHASDVLQTSASRARGLVTALLEYCFDTAAALNIESINVRDEVERAIADLSILIHEAEAKIDDVIPAQLHVKADKTQFTRLVRNLVANAIKFHKVDEPPQIVICATRQRAGDGVQLSVRDNGIGFEPGYKEAIFEPFFRLQSATRIPGNGIGLAAVKSICERHGWNVEAKSFPGQGATFRVHMSGAEPPKAAFGL
ncbi:MAG: ATP-binding protein, partial [Methylocystis sp.]